MKLNKLVVTDLDGTLLNDKRGISATNRNCIHFLASSGIKIAVATGRSIYSARKVLDTSINIDYIICSMGGAIFNWETRHLLSETKMNKDEIHSSISLFVKLRIDFTIQEIAPHNHIYQYFAFNSIKDFERRNNLYNGFCKPLGDINNPPEYASQVIGFIPQDKGEKLTLEIKKKLTGLNVIRSTSPLDHKTVWLEVYPKGVSKKAGIDYIAEKEDIKPDNILVIGNDFNDIDMLGGFTHSFVVDNAPSELKTKYPVVSTNNEDGFSEAVERWLNKY